MIGAMARRARFFLLCVLITGAIAAASWYAERRGPVIEGEARVIDGDSLRIAGAEIRLYGIDAPELRQTCFRGGERWNCGVEAARTLRTAIARRRVACRTRERDRYERLVAVCHAEQLDLAAAMVRGGFALAYGAYEADEREARAAGRGIWSSSFDPPSVWRARNPRRARYPAP